MDLVTISLDLLLAMLLIAALTYGVRLERRLKALREGHAVFAQAVRELDQSVLRAEAGLDQLRKAGEEARDGLHDRILKAREARTELEKLIHRAERVRPLPQAAPEPAPAPAPYRQIQPAPAPAAYRQIQPGTATAGFRQIQPAPALRQVQPAPLAGEEAAAERFAAAILSLGEPERVPEYVPEYVPDRIPELRRGEPGPSRTPEHRPSRRAHALDDDLFEAPSPEIRRTGGLRR